MTAKATPVTFERADPILRVASVARSLSYYVEVLGFINAEWGGDDFTCVSRDGADIYLSEGDQGVRERGCGSASATSTRFIVTTRSAAPRFSSRRRRTLGHVRCESAIRMGTSSDSGPTRWSSPAARV